MSFKIKITGFDLMQRDIERTLKIYAKKAQATIGIHEDAQQHNGTDLTTAGIAAKNHFGTDRIPPRPFLDKGVARERNAIAKQAGLMLQQGKPPEEILPAIAEIARRGVVKQIDKTLTPPNSPRTIARKGSSHPLIDTGLMRQSVTYKIKTEEED